MTLILTQLRRLVLAASALTAACDAAAPDGREVRHSQVVVDLRQLAHAAQQGGPITIIETVTLTITPATGTEQQMSRAVSSADAPVTFNVTVETGTTRFAAAVLSNNGTALYSAETEADIQEDGFSVALVLAKQRPVLTVSPDSLQLGTQEVVNFTVANLGLDTLDWELQVLDGSLEISPPSGRLRADSSQDVFVFGGVPPGEAVLVRFASPEGELDAKVQGIPPIFAVAVTPDGGNAFVFEGETTGFATFIVRNTGNARDTYTITCAGENGADCTGTDSTSVELAAGDSVAVTAAYNAPAASGNVVLTAASSHTSDQGSVTILCCAPGLRQEKTGGVGTLAEGP
jgi:hypothetical protein